MRTSQFLIATQKETPADAEVISHQLMLRAGLIRKLAAGLYTWLPLGLRVLRKVEAIVRRKWMSPAPRKSVCRSCNPLSCGMNRAAGSNTAPNYCVSRTATSAISAWAPRTKR